MILFLLLLSGLLWPIDVTEFNLYNTDQTLDIDYLQVNCLHYYVRFNGKVVEKTEYCLGSSDENNSANDDFVNTRDRNFMFDELRQLNVTSEELLLWSSTIDLAEQYQYYIDHPDNSSASGKIVFNCTKPWFGPRCQYSFDFDETYSFQLIVQRTLKKKLEYDSLYSITNLTCYTHLECDRGGAGMCLEWREVCDGRIDCLDGGADEAECFDLEMNECNENEYRCHNGLCIAKEFSDDGLLQCLDQSDISDVFVPAGISNIPIIFDYEEYSCRPGHEQFACGDGQCVADFDTCQNKRHLLLIESVSAQGHLSHTCWITMICLTKIRERVNGTACDQFLGSSNISTYLQTCEDLIQFPTMPVLFGHVRFLYRVNDIRALNTKYSLTPDYICYDQRLCPFLTPTYFHGNYSCRSIGEFGFSWSVKPENWTFVIGLVERYFRRCLTRYNSSKNDSHHPSLYCCKNSSKCISKHRILDSISDCYHNDDEKEFELSCSIQDKLRFKCTNGSKCYSALFPREKCPAWQLHNFAQIEFQDICDRHTQMFHIIIDGQSHTDETECDRWPCNNIYTRCDGFWSCPDGADEENCTQQICPPGSLPCASLYNATFTCLSANQVGNGVIDCFGAVDEFQHCRSYKPFDSRYPGFRCQDDEKCINTDYLCDKRADCPFKDDERFCRDPPSLRSCPGETAAVHRTNAENAICLTNYLERNQFSLKTSPIYPPSESRTTEHIAQRPIERRKVTNFIANKPDDPAWPWRCNHGLYVRHWLGGNNFSYKCFCPPSYYGDQCQYQSQRVSFTAKVKLMNIRSVYAIIISLIDDNDDGQEIISYHQYTSAVVHNCEEDFNAYLTYKTRPKDSSKNYSVRVDVFNKTSLTYLASWHFAISFSFLPVNRMAVVVHVPIEQVSSPSNCPSTCHNGKCMKYINKEKFFCRCHSNWSGVRCDISLRSSDCSSDSIGIGMIQNRSICVCPLHKGGPRCLLTLSCPPGEDCFNNGTCWMIDDGRNDVGLACTCSEEWSDAFCDRPKSKLEISFHNIKLSSFVLIYTFLLGGREIIEGMTVRVITQKLTMFQRTISLYTGTVNFHLVLVKIEESYYLAVLQRSEQNNISTSIGPAQRCASFAELLNSKLAALPEIRRIKHYHVICQTYLNLTCFFDQPYMCLCTRDRHANCFKFQTTSPRCPYNFHCQHGGECLQDNLECPSTTMCNCTGCFFGNRCELYAKGIGLTLDDILRYEIRPNATIHDQTSVVKWSLALTMTMFVAGLINSVLSIMTFRTKGSRESACGLYLLAASITSLLTMSIFTIKCWFLLLTQIHPSVNHSVLRGGCITLEYVLKVCLYTDNWFSGCVALERWMTVYKGIHFNKIFSKRLARWVIIFLPLLIMVSLIHEPLYRNLFDDSEEKRLWCVLLYSPTIQNYNTIILFFHNIGPFCANLFSALYIIFHGARRRAITQNGQTYNQHLHEQFKEHRNLIISPIVLVILTIPRLIISFSSKCVKVSHNAWLYLVGYLVSFIPSIAIFFVFVLPSDFYKGQLQEAIKLCRR